MKKLFALLPLMGAIGFLYGAYSFYVGAQALLSQKWIMYASSMLFLFFALVFVVAFFSALFRSPSHSVSTKEGAVIQAMGQKVAAEIMDLKHRTNIRVNMRAPYVLVAKGINPATGQEQIFQSEWIWTNPQFKLQSQKTVDIHVDPSNPARYYMDLGSVGLPNESIFGSNLPIIALIIVFILFISTLGLSLYYVKKYKFELPKYYFSNKEKDNLMNENNLSNSKVGAYYESKLSPPIAFNYPLFNNWKIERVENGVRYLTQNAVVTGKFEEPPGIYVRYYIATDVEQEPELSENPIGISYYDAGPDITRGKTILIFYPSGKEASERIEISFDDFEKYTYSGKLIKKTIVNSFSTLPD